MNDGSYRNTLNYGLDRVVYEFFDQFSGLIH